MKSIRSLRLLSLLGFLLLVAPFYDHCNSHRLTKGEPAVEDARIDTTAVEMPAMKNDTLIVKKNIVKDSTIVSKIHEPSFFQNIYEFIDDSNSENAFEIAMISEAYFDITFKEFKAELIKDVKKTINDLSLVIRSFSFVFIILISFSIFILSLLKKVKWVNKFALTNLILLLITIICTLFFDPFFETYKQIKWGYYAFTLVQMGIYYSSKSGT